LNSSRISSPWSALQSPSRTVAKNCVRGGGRGGLLGGSSNTKQATKSSKPSKLAKLARSSKGAFDQKGTSIRSSSSSRLASLKSGGQKVLDGPLLSNEAPQEQTPSQPIMETIKDIPHEIPLTSPGPSSDHLIAQPSLLAKSLFQFWVVPHEAADSLLNIYANLYLFTAGNEAQLKSAFSTVSPDDIVKNAQRGNKGSR
jgi:hypothetical protein